MFIFSQSSQVDEYAQTGISGMGATGANSGSSLFATYFSSCLDQNQLQENAWDQSSPMPDSRHEYVHNDDPGRENFSGTSTQNSGSKETVTESRSQREEHIASREDDRMANTISEDTAPHKEPPAEAGEAGSPAVREGADAKENRQDVVVSEDSTATEDRLEPPASEEGALQTSSVEDDSLDAATTTEVARAQTILEWLKGMLGADKKIVSGDISPGERLQALGLSKAEAVDILEMIARQQWGAQSANSSESFEFSGIGQGKEGVIVLELSREDLALLESVVQRVRHNSALSGNAEGLFTRLADSITQQKKGVQSSECTDSEELSSVTMEGNSDMANLELFQEDFALLESIFVSSNGQGNEWQTMSEKLADSIVKQQKGLQICETDSEELFDVAVEENSDVTTLNLSREDLVLLERGTQHVEIYIDPIDNAEWKKLQAMFSRLADSVVKHQKGIQSNNGIDSGELLELSPEDIVLLETVAQRLGEHADWRGNVAGKELQTIFTKLADSINEVSLQDIRSMLNRVTENSANAGIHTTAVTSDVDVLIANASGDGNEIFMNHNVLSTSQQTNDKQAVSQGFLKEVLNAKVELVDGMESLGNPVASGNEQGTQGDQGTAKDGFVHTGRIMETVFESDSGGKKVQFAGEVSISADKVPDLAGARDIQNMIKNGDASVREQSPLSRKVLNQVETGAFKNLSQGKKQLTLQLNPGDLGKVQVILQVKGKDVEAVLRTSNEDTTRILGEQMTQLKDHLEKQGLRVVKLDVQNQAANDGKAGQWGGTSEHNQSREQQQASLREQHWQALRGDSEELAPEMHIPSQQVKNSLRGVDLFA